ncbi:unnamed protein product, partial [Callosobruchus maculatus]
TFSLSCSAYSCHQDTSGRPPHLQLVAEQEQGGKVA